MPLNPLQPPGGFVQSAKIDLRQAFDVGTDIVMTTGEWLEAGPTTSANDEKPGEMPGFDNPVCVDFLAGKSRLFARLRLLARVKAEAAILVNGTDPILPAIAIILVGLL